MLNDPNIDAVAISTPVSTHFTLAMEALQSSTCWSEADRGKLEEASRLLAARRKLVLMVDHTFVYTGAVGKMRELISAGSLKSIIMIPPASILGCFSTM